MPWPSLGTIHPTRGPRGSPGLSVKRRRTYTSSAGVLLRVPRRSSLRMSRVRRMRAARGSRSCAASANAVNRRSSTRCAQPAPAGPAAAADSASPGRPWCSCELGSRVCSSAYGFGAGTSVSSLEYPRSVLAEWRVDPGRLRGDRPRSCSRGSYRNRSPSVNIAGNRSRRRGRCHAPAPSCPATRTRD